MILKNKKDKKGLNEQEVTILIDAYIQVQEKKLSKEEAIQKVSKELRQRAINIGMKIDEFFRSVADISARWYDVENAFEYGFHSKFRPKAPYIFIDMVDCYQNNKTYFDEVLQTAKQQVNLHKVQHSVQTNIQKPEVQQLPEVLKGEQYFDWLSENLTNIIDIEDIVLEEEPQKYVNQQQTLETMVSIKKTETTEIQSDYIGTKENFIKWLNEQGVSYSMSKHYAEENIVTCEEIAEKKLQLSHCKFYNVNYTEAKKTADALLKEEFFKEIDKSVSKELSNTISKYMTFLKYYSKIHTIKIAFSEENSNQNSTTKNIALEEESLQQHIKQEYVEMILTEKFQRGFSKGYLDINKFIKYYNEKFNMDFNIQNQTIKNEIESKIINVGILYKSKIFPISIVSDEVKQQLIQYIYNHFEQNHKVLYYETIYQKFKEQLDTKIYDADMLKVYLQHILSKEYYFEQCYMTKERNATIDISQEIKRIMLDYGAPIVLEKIYSQLDYITEKEIKDTIKGREFISNKTGEYFHIDMFDFSVEELDEITSIIEEVLCVYDDRIEIKALLSILDEKCSYIMERFSQYSEIGKRDALKYYLGDKFSFQTYYVSSKDKNMSIEKDFDDFSRTHDFFTIEQLKSLKKDINSKLLSIVYKNAVRISETNFVSKKQIVFDVKQIDMELEKHCTGEYIPLQEIDMKFLPSVAFPWTIYLLEQYIAFYSEIFKLVHRNFAITSCTGAIVKQKSNINKFDDLLIDELVKSNIELNNDTAMKYLQSKGYFKNQNYKVDKIVEEAIMIVQQRGSF